MSDPENFIARWSRRKRKAADDAVDTDATRTVSSPPHPNSGLPEFGTSTGRSRIDPTSAGEGLGVGVEVGDNRRQTTTPLPNPPPQGGREHTVFRARESL